MRRCTKGQLGIQLDFGPTLLPISTGKRNGASQSALRILTSGMEISRLRYSNFQVNSIYFIFLVCVLIVCNVGELDSVSSGSREEEPTFATTAWIETLKVEMVAKLQSTGKEMSLVLMLL